MTPSVRSIGGMLCLSLLSNPVLSGEAVDRFNIEGGGSVTFFDDGDGMAAGGGLSFPIGRYLGGTAQVGFETIDGDGVGDTTGSSIGVGVFAGDKDIGRVGIQYSNEEVDYESSFGDVTIDSDVRRVMAEAYIQSVTLGYETSDSESDINTGFLIDPDMEVSAVSADFYPTDQSRIGLVKYGKDADRIELRTEYQFGRLGSLFARYWDVDDNDTDAFAVGVTFYFRGGSTLIQNDRHY